LLTFTIRAQDSRPDSLLKALSRFGEDTNKVKLLSKISTVFKKNYQYDSAIFYTNRSLDLAKKINYKKYIASNYGSLGIIYTNQGNYNEALNYHKKALTERQKLKDNLATSYSYNNVGDVYYLQGNYSEALINHFKSLHLKEELKESASIADSYNNIGSVYNAEKKHEESLKYHFLSLKIRQELNDKNGIAMSYNNIAINYNSLSNYTDAIKYHLLSLKIYQELANKKGSALTYGNIGNSYYYMKDYTKALEYYENSLKIRQEIADKKGIASCYHNIANVNIKLKNFTEAKKYLDLDLKLQTEMNSLDNIKDSYNSYVMLYTAEENYKEAFNAYQKYIQYRDSIFNFENDKKSTRAQIQYEFDKQQSINETEFEKQKILSRAEIEKQQYLLEKNQQSYLILEQEDKLKSLNLTKSKLELNQNKAESLAMQQAAKKDSEQKQLIIKFIIGIVFLMCVVLFLIIRSLLINKKKNAIIAQNLDEKEILLKEIHHRVKNNLQVISSLLNLQSRYIKDAGALDAIKESKERINAISLLHKEIYQNDVLKHINSKDYFTNLALNLQNTFDPEKKVQLDLSIEEVFLDIDTLIPLGLMVNELFTNCYKYGTDSLNAVIWFSLRISDGIITLNIKDNGKGFKEGIENEETNSLGFKLISLFSKKIKAEVNYKNDPGASVTLTFKIKSE